MKLTCTVSMAEGFAKKATADVSTLEVDTFRSTEIILR